MITLNAEVGTSMLVHTPILYYHHELLSWNYTIGKQGEIVAWDDEDRPVFQMNCSVNGDAGKAVSVVATKLKQIDQQLLDICREMQVMRLVTLHADLRMRVWSVKDGTCVNSSGNLTITDKPVQLLSSTIQSKFIFLLCSESLIIIDSWTMKIVGKLQSKRDMFSYFTQGYINDAKQAQLLDNHDKLSKIDLKMLFDDNLIDLGKYLNNFQKATQEIDAICIALGNQTSSQNVYRRVKEEDHSAQLSRLAEVAKQLQNITLSEMVFSQQALSVYPALNSILGNSWPTKSTLNYICENQLYYFIGTTAGTVFGIPCVNNRKQLIQILQIKPVEQCQVKFLHIVNTLLFVSWEDGQLAIYDLLDLQAHKQQVNIKQLIDPSEETRGVCLSNIIKLKVLEQKMSSFIKCYLPVYDSNEGRTNSMFAFRLYRNEVIMFKHDNVELITINHFRGIEESAKIFALLIIAEYVAICSSQGVDFYSITGHQRRVSYQQWIWTDYSFYQHSKDSVNNDYYYKYLTANSLVKFNSRYLIDRIDYTAGLDKVLSETFGNICLDSLTNQQFPRYNLQRKIDVQDIVHSRGGTVVVLRLKRNSQRRSRWGSTSYVLHCSLDRQIDRFLQDKTSVYDAIRANYELYSLFDWQGTGVPYVSKLYGSNDKIFLVARRVTIQGVGKTFTNHFLRQPGGLSAQLWAQQAVASIAFFQACVTRDVNITDEMVEAVEYYSHFFNSRFQNDGNQVLAKLTVSSNQYIVKAGINLLISRIITNKINLHPIFEYFILNLKVMQQKQHQLLSYNETFWLVYLGLGIIYSSEQSISPDHSRVLANRLVRIIDIANFQHKPYYVLVAMKIFNQGIAKWKHLINVGIIRQLISELFRIFFYYDALNVVSQEDKKFLFVFVDVSAANCKLMKQSIVRTVIYISKQFCHEFHEMLREQCINQKVHVYYPASVVELLRQFIKSEKPQSHLVLYVELLLLCLSPMTPNLRKYVQKSALNALQLMCLSYPTISFNQPSQKLSIKTQNHLYIYCLRTSTKWRTISLKDEKSSNCSIVQMSPKGTYIALLSDKLRIWRLSSGFWSGVLGAFSQDWVFQVQGTSLKWQDTEQSIRVINANPALSKQLKL